MVFDQQCNYDVILGGGFLRKIGMNLHYNVLTIEWLENIAPMGSLKKPELVTKEVESYLYQMDLENEGLDALEEAYASPILDTKYGKVEIEEVIKDNCSHLDPGKQRQLRDTLLKHETLFDGALKIFPGQPMHIHRLDPWDNTSIHYTDGHILYLRYIWKPLKKSYIT